ncbi:MAG: L-fucose:H+ symporter permease [Prevotella sp.]|nr:L-fucose:H+ symporter permease [Prevotella sp.]
MKHQKYEIFGELSSGQILPFILIACCFALWGFTNDMTPVMVSTFSKVFHLSTFEGSMVTIANYLGYLVMAIPAAILISKYNFKAGVLMGLGIYAVGALLFLPAKFIGNFSPFLGAYFTMTCGLALLETCCHPMVYCMGSESTGIRRLNLVQTFNAIGAVIGMFITRNVIQDGISPIPTAVRLRMPVKQFEVIKDHDLTVLIQPYILISAIAILLLVLIRIQNMKVFNDDKETGSLRQEISELLKNVNYRESVVAQFFYVGAQVCCWAYIIQYGMRIFMAEGIAEKEAELIAQKYNIAAMVAFAVFRFIFTWLLRYFSADRLLAVMAIVAIVLTCGTILFTDRNGLYCLIAISACMSLMFATIYGMGLRGMGKDVKLASAGMTMAVFGGAVFPAIQAVIIDSHITLLGMSSVNLSFIVPVICFVVVAVFGHRGYVRHHILGVV